MTPEEDAPQTGPLDILSTRPNLLRPLPKLIESNRTLIDPVTKEIIVISDVRPSHLVWEPLPVPPVEHTADFAEVIRMNTEGIPHPRMSRTFWVWFWILMPIAAGLFVVAFFAFLVHDWWLMGSSLVPAIVVSAILAAVIAEYEQDQEDQVRMRARMRARHRAE